MKLNEPFKLKPVLKEKIWGGRKLETILGKKLPPGKYGESWEASTHPNGTNIIETGALRGMPLDKAIEKYPTELLGKSLVRGDYTSLPVLIKFIDATEKLSVQVHPDDEYALKNEGDRGKTEMWYVLHTEGKQQLIYGLKEGTTREKLQEAIDNNRIEKYLKYVDIKSGDLLFVPAGTVHAILGGVLILEIQESSDSTYRLYDWNRVGFDGKPRPLHISKALDVINYSANREVTTPLKEKREYGYFSNLIRCPYFNTDLYLLQRDMQLRKHERESFEIVILTRGETIMEFSDENHTTGSHTLKKGETIFIPPGCKNIYLRPQIESECISVFLD